MQLDKIASFGGHAVLTCGAVWPVTAVTYCAVQKCAYGCLYCNRQESRNNAFTETLVDHRPVVNVFVQQCDDHFLKLNVHKIHDY